MNKIYEIIEMLKEELNSSSQVNTVTTGSFHKLDISKQSIYPIAHIEQGTVTLQGNTSRFYFTIILADINDVDKNGKDLTQDILNTQYTVANIISEKLRRGDYYDNGYQLADNPTLEPFTDDYDNNLCGWLMYFNIDISNTDVSIC